MNQVDFYVLEANTEQARREFACRLLDKIQKLAKTTMVLVPDANSATDMDRLLWEFPPESFLPHTRAGVTPADETPPPIEIGLASQWKHPRDVVINLCLEPVDNPDQWERLVEVVVQEPEVLSATRRHYAFYRNLGYQIQSHTIRGA